MMYNNNFVAVIKCNGNILRERSGGAVYLPFGASYSILLKNKDARRALVTIEVDGKNVLNGQSLILDGNETQEIKGFMRNMRKTNRFKFINKTREIQQHRGDRIDDGLVRVTYQFERPIEFPKIINHPNERVWSDNTTWYYGPVSDSSGTFNSINYCSSNSCKSKSFAPRSDEGITVKGEVVNSRYVNGSIGFLEPDIHTIILQLKGLTENKKVVRKAVTVRSKAKCNICGRKNRSTNKFCFNCGTYLD